MTARISASDAKNNFGGLLDLVQQRGRVEITKHGRVVAIVLTPSAADAIPLQTSQTHMIPPDAARAARIIRRPRGFDDA